VVVRRPANRCFAATSRTIWAHVFEAIFELDLFCDGHAVFVMVVP